MFQMLDTCRGDLVEADFAIGFRDLSFCLHKFVFQHALQGRVKRAFLYLQ
jgi:hypothetical protein